MLIRITKQKGENGWKQTFMRRQSMTKCHMEVPFPSYSLSLYVDLPFVIQ
jgi:hypothetical protein